MVEAPPPHKVESPANWQSEVVAVLQALEIVSETEARLGNHALKTSEADIARRVPYMDAELAPLVHRLAGALYDFAYAQKFEADPAPVQTENIPNFVQLLVHANKCTPQSSPGWRLNSVAPNGMWVMERDGVTRTVWPNQTEYASNAQDVYRLVTETGSLEMQPGFYWVYGNENAGPLLDGHMFRVYLNVSPHSVPPLIERLTVELNRRRLPFLLKALTDSRAYFRRDPVVLYASVHHQQMILESLARALDDKRINFSQDAPLCSLLLAPGIGLAEDPGVGESFGVNRSYLIAEGVWEAYKKGISSIDGQLGVIENLMAVRGINPAQPHLNPGSNQAYRWAKPEKVVFPQHTGGATDDLVLNAYRIGLGICRDAVWDGSRCSWMQDTINRIAGRLQPVNVVADPYLYSGASGIALFLAQLYQYVADPVFARTARGAVNFALTKIEQQGGIDSAAFYTGGTGLAWAVVHVGRALDDESLINKAREILVKVLTIPLNEEQDILSGTAGRILGLLALDESFEDLGLIQYAQQYADTLRDETDVFGEMMCWKTMPEDRVTAPLCGLSHGTAGIAMAFARLFAVTAIERYRETAKAAFAYERSCFQPDLGNWPDFRALEHSPPGKLNMNAHAWCHGSSGGAMARFDAAKMLGESQDLLWEARAATVATHQILQSNLGIDVTYCHGRAGQAETLLHAAQALNEPGWYEAALLATRWTLSRHMHDDLPWPCGGSNYGGGEDPSLMVGMAGLGYHLLRLHAPAQTPDILLITH